jgi:molecular chaperone GrpE
MNNMSENDQSQADDQQINAEQAQAEVEIDTPDAGEDDLPKLLEDARGKADEHWDLYMRSQAEVDNVRRRAERDVQNAHKYGTEKFINELLPVLDSMELGLQAVNGDDEATRQLLEGMQLTLKMFQDAMTKFGVTVLDPQGEAFNPEFHQAMSMQESAEVEPNTVMAVMQKGYVLNERLIRPAMVMVSKAP